MLSLVWEAELPGKSFVQENPIQESNIKLTGRLKG